jgi:hypothetical protein
MPARWYHWVIRGIAWAGILIGLALLVFLHGCDVYTPATTAEFDQNAALMRIWADQAAGGQLTPTQSAYCLEAEARAGQNYADAGHWRQPTFVGTLGPVPTTLPWSRPGPGGNP